MFSVAAGRSLGHVQWLRWRADVARPELPSHSDERLFLPAAAAVIVAVAQLSDPGSALDLLFLMPAVGAFVIRGRAPSMPAELFAVLVIAPVVAVVGGKGVLEGSFFLVVLMVLYVAWQLGSTSRATVIAVAAAVAPWLVATHLAPDDEIGWTAWTSACAFTFALGRVLRRQEALIDQLEQARNALAEHAVAEERRRIARELHDLAGHTLAAVLLHVTGARHVLRRDLDEAERALADAEAVGRSSLDQIRATVAALRTHERGTDPALAGTEDLTALVEEYRRAGLVIDVTIAGSAASLDGPLGTALHRIAREALANVARHAPHNDVELTLDVDRGVAQLRVVDRGRPAPAPDPGGGHFGIIGMQERARALGGDLRAGPTADGWQVEARLPMTAVVRGPVVAT
jgi:signal transduction histidine kinase